MTIEGDVDVYLKAYFEGPYDGTVDNLDKTVWTGSGGTTGYLPADNNMDTQVDNKDKNDIWLPNIGEGTKVP